MKFWSYDAINKQKCETKIRTADPETAHLFVQTWVPDYIFRILKDPSFSYQLFEWNKFIRYSFVVGSKWRCYGAFTKTRLDGLLSLESDDDLWIRFIATAPWNYYTIGKMRRIGSGLIYFTIRASIYNGRQGEFLLNALPDAEKFYKGCGMVATGNVSEAGLKEYRMPKESASLFSTKFKKHVIRE